METTTEKQAAAAAAAAETPSKTTSQRSNGGEGDETAPMASLKCQNLEEGDKADAGKGKRIARVSQKYIDTLLREKATGTGTYRPLRSMEYLEKYKGTREAEVRALVACSEAARKMVRAGDAAILEQYHRLGYAYTEVEEDNSFIHTPELCGPLARNMPSVPPA